MGLVLAVSLAAVVGSSNVSGYGALILFSHVPFLWFTAMAVCARSAAAVFYIYVCYRCFVFIFTSLMLISLNEASEAEVADLEEAIRRIVANRLIPFIQVVLGFIALELTIALIACSPCSPCFDTCRRGRCGELAEFN